MKIHQHLPATDGSIDFDTDRGLFRLNPNGEVMRYDIHTESFHRVCPDTYSEEVDAINFRMASTN